MVENVQSCAECTQNCMLIHAKRKDPSSIVTSFFKVMLGDKCTQLLFIPPKFARTISSLVDQKTRLEDSSGQHWIVTLSKVNGSLAFQEGWHEFSSAHRLKVGDFLVFNYIKGSHFVVQIYDQTACEKHVFSKENSSPKKRGTSGSISNTKDGNTGKKVRTSGPHSGSPDKQTSSSDFEMSEIQPVLADSNSNTNKANNVSAPEYVEEQFYMIGRDVGYIQEEYRSALYDLAEFEMNTVSVEVEKNPSPAAANSEVRSLSEFETNTSRFDGDGANKVTIEEERISGLDNQAMLSLTEAGVVATDPVAADAPTVESPLRTESLIQKDKDPLLGDKFVLSAEKGFNKIDAKLGKNLDVSKKVNFKNPEGKSNAHSSGPAKVVKTEIVDKLEHRSFEFHENLPSTIRECDQSLKMPIKDNSVMQSLSKAGVVATDPVAVAALNVESRLKTEHFIRKDKDRLSRDKFVLSAENDFEKGDAKLRKNQNVNLKIPEAKSNAHSCGTAKAVKTEVVDKIEPRPFVFHGNLPSTNTECGQSLDTPIKDNDKVLKAVKTELFTSFDFSPPIAAANISCVVERIDQDFFELPKCLPSISLRSKKLETDRKIIYLRDLLQRDWPFFYLTKLGLNVLMGGWKAFSKANSIQPGDECVFGLESEPDRIYTVSIVPK